LNDLLQHKLIYVDIFSLKAEPLCGLFLQAFLTLPWVLVKHLQILEDESKHFLDKQYSDMRLAAYLIQYLLWIAAVLVDVVSEFLKLLRIDLAHEPKER
jgi:hypothetical protein